MTSPRNAPSDEEVSSSPNTRRVLIVAGEHPEVAPSGGLGSFVDALATGYTRHGHEVHVLTCQRGADVVDRRSGAVTIHVRPQMRLPGLAVIVRSDALAARVRAALSAGYHVRSLAGHWDIIEVPDWNAEGLLVSRGGSAALVAQIHGGLPFIQEAEGIRRTRRDRAAGWLERMSVHRADLVIAPSGALLEEVRRRGWIGRRARAAVIGHGVVPGPQPPVHVREPIILCVTKFTRLKGLDLLLEAARGLEDVPDVEIVVAGGVNWISSYAAACREAAQRLQMDVTFLGEISPTELHDWYARAGVVVVPSRFEAFSMVALEAMAAGTPVVCGSNAGAAGLVASIDPLCVVDPTDPVLLAEALRRHLAKPDDAARTSQLFREALEQHAGMQHLLARRLESIESVVARRLTSRTIAVK